MKKCTALTRKKTGCSRQCCADSKYCTQHHRMYGLLEVEEGLRLPQIRVHHTSDVTLNTSSANAVSTIDIERCFLCLMKFEEVDIDDDYGRILKFECGHFYHEDCAVRNKVKECTVCVHQCCCCLDDIKLHTLAPIKCGHLICAECFGKLRKPVCPVCKTELRSSCHHANRMISAMNRRMEDDKEEESLQIAMQLLQPSYDEVCSIAVDIFLNIQDIKQEEAMVLLRQRYSNCNQETLEKAIAYAYEILN